ncbi:thioredoxin family protein [Halomonas denitrificans]|uniref:thioredoxin family protein n=1 Tax=Halomonas denitrificans TaxID=370769 RepID=UPI000D3A574D|nr:thioredoxin family protein [Halomonas denitrificans]
MTPVADRAAFEATLAAHPAVLVLFGGRACGVCQAIKPRLEALLAAEFPRLEACYADCQGEAAALCAQRRIFSLPVVELWFDGQRFATFARVFSLAEVRRALERPYAALFADS